MSQIVDDLRQVAIEIKTETQVGGNTAARVGGAFERVADALEGTQQIEDMDAAVAAVQQAAQENEQTIQDIVNSLAVVQTTGQSTSAVMSQKAVTDEILYVDGYDLSQASYPTNIISSANKWAAVANTSSILIPVSEGQRLRIKGNGNSAGTIYAFLQNNNTTTGSTPSFATGYSGRISKGGSETFDITIPPTTHYLWFIRKNADGWMMPYLSNVYNIGKDKQEQFAKKLRPAEKWNFKNGDSVGSSGNTRTRASDYNLYYIEAGTSMNIPNGMQLAIQQFNEDGPIGSEIAVNLWLEGTYTFTHDGWYRFLSKNTSGTDITDEQFASLNSMTCERYINAYSIKTAFKHGVYLNRTNGMMTFYRYTATILDTDQVVNDRFFELNGDKLTINCNRLMFVIFFNDHYETVGDTITSLGKYKTCLSAYDYSSITGAKFIRIVAQGADEWDSVEAEITSGVYDNQHDSADVTVSVTSDTEIVAPKDDATQAIQQAIFLAYIRGGKAILYEDDYILNSTTPWTDKVAAPKCCLWVPHIIDEISQYSNPMQFFMVEGTKQPLSYSGGVRLILGEDVYNAVTDESPLSVIRTAYQSTFGVISPNGGVSALALKNLNILLPNNDKAITAIDLRYAHGCNIENVNTMAGYSTLNWGHTNPPPIANPNCVGIRGLFGSNWSVLNTFTNVEAFGYYIGIDFSGEHLSGRNISVKFNYYGMTFGYLQEVGGHDHPTTIINILDEHSVCLPIFGAGGNSAKQEVNLFGYNLMWPSWVSQGDIGADDVRHHRAVEQGGNGWGGVIYYTNNTSQDTGLLVKNVQDSPFFETNGKNIKCVNTANSRSGDNNTLAAMEPNYLQKFWHTTRNMECLFDGSNWKNAVGEVIYEYPTYTLHGTVTSSGSPVSGAAVKYTYRGVNYTTTTGSDGTYSLTVPKWTGMIEVSKSGYTTFGRRIKMTANTTLNVVLNAE